MSNAGAVTPVIAAASQQNVQALGSFGLMVRVGAGTFLHLVAAAGEPMVLHGRAGLLRRAHRWVLSHRGYVFWTETSDLLPLDVDVVEVGRLRMPEYW